jgi:3-methyladenine DNA glycosylase/8-oxoguanine DNA glycosylase
MFLDLVKKVEGMEVEELTDRDLDILSRNQLNGRQIKNILRTAQALALNENKKLTLGHIRRVIDVAETFDRDLKGGTGYLDAMRSYT